MVVKPHNIIEDHSEGNKSCVFCDCISTYKKDIDFPLKHKKCGGLIHFDDSAYDDGCGYYNHNAVFECDKCGKRIDTWYDTPKDLDEEFFKVFKFHFFRGYKNDKS